ncbi:MAG: histidine kinase [Kofleriaceae bacterium]|nr:histidine kinase [Kofleriaceae bacterium]
MRRRLGRFWLTAMIGYGVVVLLLAGGMILAARRFNLVAATHVNQVRTGENQITFAERLRWSGEAIVSTGRGYLISGDPVFLQRLRDAQDDFDRGIRTLTQGTSDVTTSAFVTAVEGDAKAFRSHQEILVEAAHGEDMSTLARRFETELVPLQRELGASLDRLIDHEESAIDDLYRRVAGERSRLRGLLNTLVGILVAASLAIAAYIANVLGRSYRKEQTALQTSRRAVAARDEIMGIVAHDLRNPLASILLHAEVLREGEDSATTKIHAERIEAVALRMESLIGSMLDVATIESGHLSVIPRPTAVSRLVDTVFEMFGDAAAKKQLVLERPRERSELVVRADQDRVVQVLQNLVGNATKFTPQGGRISIAAVRDGEFVRFQVSDNGPGIVLEDLASVFDRFWKHETRGKKGTGLGLFIAKGIVEAHGGRIWLESVPGRGATFYFTLPLCEGVAATSSCPARGGPQNEVSNIHEDNQALAH